MLRTTAASILALATAILPVQAQTVLYGEPPVARPVFPQPYFGEPQPLQPAPPLYYETVPAPQQQNLLPPAIYEPEPEARQFRAIPQQGVTQTRPLLPVEQYRPPQPAAQDIFLGPTIQQQQQPTVAIPPPALAPVEPSRFAPSEPELTESEALLDFSEELSRIVSLGERYRAASPGFLDDLKALADRYRALPVRTDAPDAGASEDLADANAPDAGSADLIGPPAPSEASMSEAMPEEMQPDEGTEVAMLPDAEPVSGSAPEIRPEPEPQELPQALPPTSASLVYLRDDFADGDYLSNPAWNVRQGQFTVDPAFGLRPFTPEATTSPQVTPQALLQYLIGEGVPQTAEPAGDTGASLIEAQTDIGNAFSMVATITDHGGEGAAHFILHQGGANWLGYRLELRAGPRPLVVLARRGSSGYKDIMKVEAPGFTTGKPHQLRWARLDDGQMFVLIDGRPIITARDTVFRQNWTGFAYFTADADISMRNIRIAEPVEQ